jgi:hypothetical protein
MGHDHIDYYFSPDSGLYLSLIVWLLIPYFSGFISFEFVFFFISCVVINLWVHIVMIDGWSNSNYPDWGGGFSCSCSNGFL